MTFLPSSKVHIIGAGLAGLTLARSLRNKGIQVTIFEKNPSPARHTYGISLERRTCQALLKVLRIDEATFCRRVAVDAFIGGRGVLIAEKNSRSRNEDGFPSPFRAHRGRLEALLREDLDVKWGYAINGIYIKDSRPEIKFKERDEVDSTEIIIDTSGVHSAIRKELLPSTPLNILPYVVFRGTRRIDTDTFNKTYKPHFSEGNLISTRQNDILLQISISDYREDNIVEISYIYSRPARPNDPLHKPQRGLEDSVNISEAFYTEASTLHNLPQPFEDTLRTSSIRKDLILHWLMRDLLIPLENLKELSSKGVVLLGDSVRATPIIGGKGGNYAIIDAIELSECVLGGESVEEFYERNHRRWEGEREECERRLEGMHFDGRAAL